MASLQVNPELKIIHRIFCIRKQNNQKKKNKNGNF